VVLRGNAGYGSFTDAVVHDPAIAALRHRVHIAEDAQMSAVAPHLKPARVTVTLTDGRQSTQTCESARGDFQRPYQEAEIRQKFRELAGLVLTPEGVTSIEQAVQQCEQWTSVRELTDQLRRYGRP
jgi:2-methylcitrate dehydratase PrpD